MEGPFMAKALLGHLDTGAHSSRLLADNQRLRARVADLEHLVTTLQLENERLRVDQVVADLDGSLQPA